MISWPVQDAKARFSELLNACLKNGPQIVTRRGEELAVLVPMAEWERLQNSARPSLKDLLTADHGRNETDIELPTRVLKRRPPLSLS